MSRQLSPLTQSIFLLFLFPSNHAEACKYKIAELVKTSSDLNEYAEYAFIVRERVGT
jgi:hypothetical protein